MRQRGSYRAYDDLRYGQIEPLRIIHIPLVVTEYLFVNVTEQMERFDRNVCAVDPALQERPEILATIRVNLSVDVRLGMVYELVTKLVHSFVREQGVRVNVRSGLNILANELLSSGLRRVLFTCI